MKRKFFVGLFLFSLVAAGTVMAQVKNPKSKPKEYTPHRGVRVKNEQDVPKKFRLIEIKSTKAGSGMFIDFVFNKEINPNEISVDSFIFDGKKIESKSGLKFNRNGNVVRIFVDSLEIKKLRIEKIQSFGGEKIFLIECENVLPDATIEISAS